MNMEATRMVEPIPAAPDPLANQIAVGEVERYKVVSLFCGCGGMDLGFLGGFSFAGTYYDRLSFDVVWANDIDERACDTYAANIGEDHLRRGDVAEVLDTLPSAADVVIGGFPCQDVSVNGRQSLEDGERTILYKYMVEAVRRCQPRIFVAENVKGLLMSHGKPFFDQMLADFAIEGYAVNHQLYLAADYGVPQMRERVFIVGAEGAAFAHPFLLSGARPTAREALADLEDAPEDRATAHIWSKARRSPDQGDRKLRPDRPATTIRAEHHGNTQWHYNQPRRISLREAARLQSFPDAFTFAHAMRASERQIGNAVPPVLGWHVAKAVEAHLRGEGTV